MMEKGMQTLKGFHMNKRFVGCYCVVALIGAVHGWPVTSWAQDSPDFAAQQKSLLELTNAERKKKDLAPVKASPLLYKVALAHSQSMAKAGKLEHKLDGKSPLDRLRDAGYQFNSMGENVARLSGSTSMETLMKMWIESKIHRDNILNPDVTEIGLGLASDGNGQIYYTQILARPR